VLISRRCDARGEYGAPLHEALSTASVALNGSPRVSDRLALGYWTPLACRLVQILHDSRTPQRNPRRDPNRTGTGPHRPAESL
jgi:hypothetical protein